jgi:hypothetical protein
VSSSLRRPSAIRFLERKLSKRVRSQEMLSHNKPLSDPRERAYDEAGAKVEIAHKSGA